ncbi:MAG: epoxyalkane--coenzyme M transferase, partial [Acidimicrobiia bacterium]|nr:epoxyalkane--coenzyme M transferase [Acidimicrobiia bacterium]
MPASQHIRSTHTGSLPRPDDLITMMWAMADGVPVDQTALGQRIDAAVAEVVRHQVEAGVTVVNDGEMSKPSYATYVQDRLTGFEGESPSGYHFADLVDFPRSAQIVADNPGRRKRAAPACVGPITVRDGQAAIDDMDRLSAAAMAEGATATFSSAASPGVISLFFPNEYYDSHEAYVFAIAEAMRHEYEAIAAAGSFVQLDCPDLAMGRHTVYADLDAAAFVETIRINIAALNHAVANIPAEQLRMHLCWGNYPGPHHHDVSVADIIDSVWEAKPQTVLLEGANPRHAHEWALFAKQPVPDHKV